jgi:hypothetical protein
VSIVVIELIDALITVPAKSFIPLVFSTVVSADEIADPLTSNSAYEPINSFFSKIKKS